MRQTVRAIRGVAIGLVALLVVSAVGGALLLDNVDLNNHVDRIRRELSSELGRPVKILGRIDQDLLTFSPTLTIRQLEIGGPKWAPDRPTVTVARVDLAFDWIDLLKGRVRIHRIHLLRPRVLLEVSRKGEASWEFFEVEDPTGAQSDDPWLLVQRFRVDGGQVTYIDRRSGAEHKILVNSFGLKHRSLQHPSDWAFDGSLNGHPLHISGRTAQVRKLISGTGGPSRIKIGLGKSRLSARLSALRFGQKLVATGNVEIDRFDLREVEAILARGGGKPTQGPQPAGFLKDLALDLKVNAARVLIGDTKPLRLVAHLASTANGVRIRSLRLRNRSGVLSGNLSIDTATRLEGTLLATYGKKRVRVSGTIGSVQALADGRWTPIRARATDGNINLSTDLRLLLGQRAWRLTGSISGDKLTIGDHANRQKSPSKRSPLIPQEIADLFKKGAADLQVSVRRVSVRGVTFNNLRLSVQIAGSSLRIPRYRMTVLGSSFSGNLALNLDRSIVGLSGQTSIRSRAIGEIDKDLAQAVGPTDVLLTARYRSRGKSLSDLFSNVDGQAQLVVTSTAKPAEVSLIDKLATGALGPVVILARDRGGKLRCVVGRMVFRRGVGKTDHLLIETAKVTYRGEGTFNLRTRRVSAVFVPVGRGFLRGNIRPFAIRVSGPLQEPRVRLDVGASAIQTLKSIANTSKVPLRLFRRLRGAEKSNGPATNTCQRAAQAVQIQK